MQIQHAQNLGGYRKNNSADLFYGNDNQTTGLDRAQRKEILILKNLGLQNYEIQYLVFLKNKERLGKKWKR